MGARCRFFSGSGRRGCRWWRLRTPQTACRRGSASVGEGLSGAPASDQSDNPYLVAGGGVAVPVLGIVPTIVAAPFGKLGSVRVFAAIGLPEDVRDHLAGALEMVAPPYTSRHPWSPSLNWHITMAFYGERPASVVEELTDGLQAAARRTAPFELALAGAGVFRHEVCWVGVSDQLDALGRLASQLRQSYATADQHTQNRFHVTVARAGRRTGWDRAMAALSVYRGPAWTVDAVTLYQSELGAGPEGHPRYTPLAEARLGPRPYVPTGGTLQ